MTCARLRTSEKLEKTSLISRRDRMGWVGEAEGVEVVEGAVERSDSAVEVRVRGCGVPYSECRGEVVRLPGCVAVE